MGDAVDALATGLFVAALVYAVVRWMGDQERAGRSALVAFLTATPVNYLGRRVIGSRTMEPEGPDASEASAG